MRAAKIYTAKAEAAAAGKRYRPLRRKRASSGVSGDPYASPAWREQVASAEPEEGPPLDCFIDLSDEEVAAAARAFWLDDLCERRDAEHDEGLVSFVLYE